MIAELLKIGIPALNILSHGRYSAFNRARFSRNRI